MGRGGGQKKKRMANYKLNSNIKSKKYSVDGFPKVFVYLFDVRVGREGGVWRSQIQFDGPQLHMAAPTCLRMMMMLTMKMMIMEEMILVMIFLNKLICFRAFAYLHIYDNFIALV